MKFTIFQSDKGDCVLLESDDGKLLLADGGMRPSYSEHVAPALGALRKAGREIDVAYVSHIDQDHIAGILQLMDDEVAWRVFDHQKANGNTHVKAPKVPRPPKVNALWHNAFHDQVPENTGEIEDMLAASASILAAAQNPKLLEASAEHRLLALSKAEAIRLSNRVSAKQLGISLNAPASGKLMLVRAAGDSVALGKLKLFVIGPFAQDLRILRKEWNEWLEANREAVQKLRDNADRDEENLGNSAHPLIREMEITAEEFGDRKKVTAPNLASLMFYVEEPRTGGGVGKRYILTGDGHCDDILKGLAHHQKLDQQSGKGIHVDVLKGQHHGSEHNWNEKFVRAVTANHYIFCGNGENTNPELKVVKLVLDSRVGPAAARSPNAETGQPFTVWFNSSEAVATDPANARHMKALNDLMTDARQRSSNVRFRFLAKNSFSFSV